MKFKFQEIEMAIDYVSFGSGVENTALLDKSTGEIHYHSELDDEDEIPDELWDSDNAVQIPHKNDLDLGNQLVFDFAMIHAPDDYEDVQDMFRRRGAYSRFKRFVESKNLLQRWYDFEKEAQEKTLRQWCKENEIELSD
jgi:hypothetical protein